MIVEVVKQVGTWHVSSEMVKMSVSTRKAGQDSAIRWRERQSGLVCMQGFCPEALFGMERGNKGGQGASKVGSYGKTRAPAEVGWKG